MQVLFTVNLCLLIPYVIISNYERPTFPLKSLFKKIKKARWSLSPFKIWFVNEMQDVELNMGQGVCLFIRICQESKMVKASKKEIGF